MPRILDTAVSNPVLDRARFDAVFRAIFATLALWPVQAFLLYSVYARVQGKYLAALLTSSGLDDGGTWVDRLFLYRNDLLVVGVLLPTALVITLLLIRRRSTLMAWAGVVVTIQLLLYANLQSWGQVGRFLSWQALVNAITFGLSKPEFVGEYLALDGLAKLAVLLAASMTLLWAAARLSVGSMWLRIGAGAAVLGIVVSAAASAFGQTSSMKRVPVNGSFLVNAVEALSMSGAHRTGTVAGAELDSRFEQLAGAPLADSQGPTFGAAKGKNLLLFVMETGSIEFLDVRPGLPAHPVLKRLGPGLVPLKNHFSTFPASAESNLSLLTGLYPPRALYDTCLIDAPSASGQRPVLPGFIPALRGQGYQTVLYAPFRSQVPADKVVFEMTGFERVFYGQDHDPGQAGGSDNRTFQELLADLERWGAAGQRFAVGYFPQVGHGPWPPTLGATIRERGQRVVHQQLDWLGKLVDVLEKAGTLDRTVILLTGDHGVRTSLEDPRVKVGMVDWYSLHVPLLLFAPGISYAGLDQDAPSSHIDVAAEMAQLFGLPRTPAMQGLPWMHPMRGKRRQFLIANWYFGADGYRDHTEAAMYSEMLDTAYRRTDGRVEFSGSDTVKDQATSARIRAKMGDLLDLQESWIRERACRPMAEAGKMASSTPAGSR